MQHGMTPKYASWEARHRSRDLIEGYRGFQRLLRHQLTEAGLAPDVSEAALRCAAGLPSLNDGYLSWARETYRYQHRTEVATGSADEHPNLVSRT